jgi:dihydrofolate synthase / folylpolyglutamate synthase
MPRFSQAEAEAYLLGFINYENLSRYRPTTHTHDLDRFRTELDRRGWRPRAVPTVHVGGTNGKGTVSTLLERMLRAGGLRTGLYTSPHLRSMRERIRIEGRPLASARFRDAVSRLARESPPDRHGFRTTFEHLTALAFLAFQEDALDVAVIEVGLGGRLDATNVLPPGPAVLTPISMDHRQILGPTVTRIAGDKAHILKRGGQAYLCPQTPHAWETILRRCRREKLEPVRTWDEVRVEIERRSENGTTFRISGRREYGEVATRLLGEHQIVNVAGAIAVAETLLPPDALQKAVGRGLARVRVPGRLDLRSAPQGRFLLDGGHNPAAARGLARALATHFPGARVSAVIAMARDKDHRGYLGALAGTVDSFHFTSTGSPRSASPETLRGKSPHGGTAHAGVRAAIRAATEQGADLILVAGSFLLVGEIMHLFDFEV